MAVILETSVGDITIDLYVEERPKCCLNFLKLCKLKYYNFCLFHSVQQNLVAQTGDPSGTGRGGESVYQKLYGDQARFFEWEVKPVLKHKKRGTVSMVNNGDNMHASQFFITLGENIDYLDKVHTVFGEVAEGFDVLDKINDAFVDAENRPYKDIRILHTVVLDDPLDDPEGFSSLVPDRSPEPTKEQLQSLYLGMDENIDDEEGLSKEELEEMTKTREEKANAHILEMVGDIPDVDVKPPENVLFVCKLNQVTTDEDLEVIFSRFGEIRSCEVIRDFKTGKSLQYAFIEFENVEDCEKAFFKMDNVLIDDRRIHVDFSQSVSKMKWQHDKEKAARKENSKEDARPSFIIKDSSKKDNYELVLEEEYEDDEKSKESQRIEKEAKQSLVKSKQQHNKVFQNTDRYPKHKRSRSHSSTSSNDSSQPSRHHKKTAKPEPSHDKHYKHRSHSKDRRSRSREKRNHNKEHRSRSKERFYSSKEHRSRSKERFNSSKERRSRSKERYNPNKDHHSKERINPNKERCSRSKNRSRSNYGENEKYRHDENPRKQTHEKHYKQSREYR